MASREEFLVTVTHDQFHCHQLIAGGFEGGVPATPFWDIGCERPTNQPEGRLSQERSETDEQLVEYLNVNKKCV